MLRGDSGAAQNLLAQTRGKLPRRLALHFGPSLDGTVLLDMTVANRDAEAADPRNLLPLAGAIIDRWQRSNPEGNTPARSAIPRQVVQYWDKAVVPADIEPLMRSWQDLPGIAYFRFDRRGAMDWLATRLDDSWRLALRAARSPAEESDFFRLAWLMLEGGLYVDCDDRRTGDLAAVFARHGGLTVCAEPQGSIANNVILAAPLHPAIVWAAHAARRALLERHSDNTWIKTGPGLVTRAVAWYIAEGSAGRPDLSILPQWTLRSWVQIHVRLPYKRTANYWNAQSKGEGTASDLADCARSLLGNGVPAT